MVILSKKRGSGGSGVNTDQFIIANSVADYIADNAIEFLGFFNKNAFSNSTFNVGFASPINMTIKNWLVDINVYSGQTNILNPVLRINAIDTVLTFTDVLNTPNVYEVIADVDVDKGEILDTKWINTGNIGLMRVGSMGCVCEPR